MHVVVCIVICRLRLRDGKLQGLLVAWLFDACVPKVRVRVLDLKARRSTNGLRDVHMLAGFVGLL